MGVDHDPVFIIGFHTDLKQAKALISDEELKVMEEEDEDDDMFFEEAAAMLECKYHRVGNSYTGDFEYFFVCEYPKIKEFGLYSFDDIAKLGPQLEHIRLRAKERGVDIGQPLIGASLLTW
jgi:hypothetical protein